MTINQSRLARRTRQTIRHYVVDFCADFADRPANTLTIRDVDALWEAMAGLGPASKNRALTWVKRILNWSVERGHLFHNPLQHVKRLNEPLKPFTLTMPVFKAVRAAAPDHLQWAMDVQFYLMLRTAELFPLGWDTWHWSEGIVYVQQAKGLPIKRAYISEEFKAKAWPRFEQDTAQGRRHVIHYAGRPIRSLKTAWNLSKKRARVQGREVMHDIRHLAITTALSMGIDPKAVAEQAGHSSMEMISRRYGHLVPGAQRRLAEALPMLE